mgnify:CR=1 FL=1
MTTAALFVLLFVFMLLGMPVAVALGLSSLITILLFAQDSLASLSLKLFETSEHYTLLAIPFFILGGAFMTTGGVAKRMIRFANACIGHLRGGLAMASVMACMLFAAVSGSSPATVVAVGSIVLLSDGFDAHPFFTKAHPQRMEILRKHIARGLGEAWARRLAPDEPLTRQQKLAEQRE